MRSAHTGESAATVSADAEPTANTLHERYQAVRRATEALAAPLSAEDCQAQSMTETSPVKWHLAHTTWFFETLVLEHAFADYRPFEPQYREMFNSYYNAIGRQHPRPKRGLLTRPSLDEVMAYRAYVDGHMGALLERELSDENEPVWVLGLQHEQQHQELILMDVKHLLSFNPLYPVYAETMPRRQRSVPHEWVGFEGGMHWIGDDGNGFAFDNERPRHQQFIEAFELGSRPVTVGEFLAFIEDGGYRRPELWLSDGWDAVQAHGWDAPAYWQPIDGRWYAFTLGGLRELQPDEPVCHVSYYEADAYASWAGARLPRENEWEVAAAGETAEGHFVEGGEYHPAPVGGGGRRVHGLYGHVWEWTQSAYSPYPGYRPPEGALGEYNGKFMCNQMVLRGGCCASPRSHIRATYRNFFPPDARWPFCGFRLARDPA